MRYFYDTEFIADGKTIDLISIGIVAQDGREYYAISRQFDAEKADDWVKTNVLDKLPEPFSGLNIWNPLYKRLPQIRDDIALFITEEDRKDVELWGYYSAYDHVVLCNLFGKMIDLPPNIPMFTHDIKQWCDQLGNQNLPEQGKGEHDALQDAKWNKIAYEFLASLQKNQANG